MVTIEIPPRMKSSPCAVAYRVAVEQLDKLTRKETELRLLVARTRGRKQSEAMAAWSAADKAKQAASVKAEQARRVLLNVINGAPVADARRYEVTT